MTFCLSQKHEIFLIIQSILKILQICVTSLLFSKEYCPTVAEYIFQLSKIHVLGYIYFIHAILRRSDTQIDLYMVIYAYTLTVQAYFLYFVHFDFLQIFLTFTLSFLTIWHILSNMSSLKGNIIWFNYQYFQRDAILIGKCTFLLI